VRQVYENQWVILSTTFTSLMSPHHACAFLAGVIEYRSYDDMQEALRTLHNRELRGNVVKLYEVGRWLKGQMTRTQQS